MPISILDLAKGNGRTVYRQPSQAKVPRELEFLPVVQEWAEDRGLDLGADTNLPFCDGTRPDYDWAEARGWAQGGGAM